MSTLNDVVLSAYERIGVTSEDLTISAYQQQRGLKRLNEVLQSLRAHAASKAMVELVIDRSQTLLTGGRLLFTRAQSYTITMPEMPEQGSIVEIIDAGAGFATYPQTVVGNNRKVNGAAANYTINTDGARVILMYRSDLADWTVWASSYAGPATIPLPPHFDSELADMLAEQLMDVSGKANDPSNSIVMRRATRASRVLYARLGDTRKLSADPGLLRTPGSALQRGNVSAGLNS